MDQSNNVGMWVIVALVIGLAMLGGLVNNNSNTTTVSTPERNSFEHRYATERFKQEGYTSSEAQQAADAVIKFNNAQKARQR